MGNPNSLFIVSLWAIPVIVLQWAVGLDIFAKRWKVWLPGILLPSLYLTLSEVIPISARRGATPGGLIPLINVPAEDAFVYLSLNTLIVQGLMLAMYFPLVARRVRRYVQVLRRGPFRNEPPDED